MATNAICCHKHTQFTSIKDINQLYYFGGHFFTFLVKLYKVNNRSIVGLWQDSSCILALKFELNMHIRKWISFTSAVYSRNDAAQD